MKKIITLENIGDFSSLENILRLHTFIVIIDLPRPFMTSENVTLEKIARNMCH